GLAEGRAVGSQQDLPEGPVLALEPLDAVRDGLGLQDHARTAPVGPVVYRAVAVAREVAEVDRLEANPTLPLSLAQDARSQVRLERLGEEGEEDDLHGVRAIQSSRHPEKKAEESMRARSRGQARARGAPGRSAGPRVAPERAS